MEDYALIDIQCPHCDHHIVARLPVAWLREQIEFGVQFLSTGYTDVYILRSACKDCFLSWVATCGDDRPASEHSYNDFLNELIDRGYTIPAVSDQINREFHRQKILFCR